MAVTLGTDTPLQVGQLGHTISYTLRLINSGSVPDTYQVTVEGRKDGFKPSLYEVGYDAPLQILNLAPQDQVSVTVWVRISSASSLTISNTFTVKAVGFYGVTDEIQLTTHISAFQEANGQVVIEAEHFTDRIEPEAQFWTVQSTLPDFAGTGYMSTLPDIGSLLTLSDVVTNPKLSYSINFTTTGVYTIWLRGYAPNAAGDSAYVGLEGPSQITTTMLTGFAPRQWFWTNSKPNGVITINVTSAGLHTLHLWQREDGLRLDKIILTTDNVYVPIDQGPAESNFN